MTSQEVLNLARAGGIFLGVGLDISSNAAQQGRVDDQGAFTAWTKRDVQDALHGATAAARTSSDATGQWNNAEWWSLGSSLPGVGEVVVDVTIREIDKTLVVTGMSYKQSS